MRVHVCARVFVHGVLGEGEVFPKLGGLFENNIRITFLRGREPQEETSVCDFNS